MTPIRKRPVTSKRPAVTFWIVTCLVLVALFAGKHDVRSVDDLPANVASAPAVRTTGGTNVPDIPLGDVQEAHSIDTAAVGGTTTSIAKIASPISVHRGATLSISGWAVDVGAHLPSSGVVAVVDGHSFSAAVGGDRQDVATALGSPAYAPSAFRIDVDTSSLPLGHSVASFYGVDAARRVRYVFHDRLEIDVTK